MYPFHPRTVPSPYIVWGLLGGPMNPAVYPAVIAYCWYVDWLKSVADAMDAANRTGKSS